MAQQIITMEDIFDLSERLGGDSVTHFEFNPFTDENSKNMMFARLKTVAKAFPETRVRQGDCITTIADLYDLYPELEGAICTEVNRRLFVIPRDGEDPIELCEILQEETEQ